VKCITENNTNDICKCSALEKIIQMTFVSAVHFKKLFAKCIKIPGKSSVTHNIPILLISFCYMFRLKYRVIIRHKIPALYVSRNMQHNKISRIRIL